MKKSPLIAICAALGLCIPAHAQSYPYPYYYPYPYPYYYAPGYGYAQGYPASPQTYPDAPQGYPDDTQGYPDNAPSNPDNTQEYPDNAQGYPGNTPSYPDNAPGYPGGTQTSQDSTAELLAAHNQYRASLGLPPLHWSSRLADKAKQWAEHLAQIGQLVHSGSGQNLAMASAGSESLTQLVQLWGNEQSSFTNGDFPDISTTGNWKDVGHYSQMIWRSTTEVGCGLAQGNGSDFLVCDYDPPGNVMGERAY